MSNVYHINTERINYVMIKQPIQLDFKWFDEQTIKYFFGLYKTTDKCGWSININTKRYSTQELINKGYMIIDGNQWVKKARVFIAMGDDYITEYFQSMAECEEFVNEMLSKSKSKFQVLND